MILSGVFLLIGSLTAGRTSDYQRKKAVQESGNENVLPERRITSQIYGFILAAAGLCMYGWFCRYQIHPSAVLASSALGMFFPSSNYPAPPSLFHHQSTCFVTIPRRPYYTGNSFLGALGLTWTFATTTSYQTECFPAQAASLVALTGLTRYVAAAISAALIERLSQVMGFGWCFTGLAILMVLCIPGVLLIMKKGAAFRQAIQEEK